MKLAVQDSTTVTETLPDLHPDAETLRLEARLTSLSFVVLTECGHDPHDRLTQNIKSISSN